MAATGFTSDSTVGYDDGSLTVAQVRTPSTPFNSDMNPYADFQFSGSEEVVTVKKVEEIVTAVRDSFNRFIETQRDYLSKSQASTEKNASTAESESAQPSSTTSTESTVEKDSSETESLTEARVYDIIKATDTEKSFSEISDINGSLDELNKGLSDKIDEFSNKISEKLIKTSDEESQDLLKTPLYESPEASESKYQTLLDYITESSEKTKTDIERLTQEKEKPSLERVIDGYDSSDIDIGNKPGLIEALEGNTAEMDISKGLSGLDTAEENEIPSPQEDNVDIVNRLEERFDGFYDDFEDIFNKNNEETESNEEMSNYEILPPSSLEELFEENNQILESLRSGADALTKDASGYSTEGMASSMMEMMLQNSFVESIASNTADKISASLSETIKTEFGNVIKELGNKENQQEQPSLPNMFEENDVEEMEEGNTNGFTDNNINDEINTEKTETVDISDLFERLETVDASDNNESIISETKEDIAVPNKTENNSGFLSSISNAFNSFTSLFSSRNEEEKSEIATTSVVTEEEIENEELGNPILNNSIQSEIFENEIESPSMSQLMDRILANNNEMNDMIESALSKSNETLDEMSRNIEPEENPFGTNTKIDESGFISDDFLNEYIPEQSTEPSTGERMSIRLADNGANEMDIHEIEINETNGSVTETNESLLDKSDISALSEDIMESRRINGERFDRIETMLKDMPKTSTSNTSVVASSPQDDFMVERIG